MIIFIAINSFLLIVCILLIIKIYVNFISQKNSKKDKHKKSTEETEYKFAELKGILQTGLQNAHTERMENRELVGQLNKILSESRSRGKYGEKKATELLNSYGLKENLDYIPQYKFKNADGSNLIIDFAFLLPQDKKLFVDVKFPYDNYDKMIKVSSELNSADNEILKKEKEKQIKSFAKHFLSDVKKMINGLSNKKYHNSPDAVDIVLVYLPIQSIYDFVCQENPEIINYALNKNIGIVSPVSFVAIISIIKEFVIQSKLQKSKDLFVKEYMELLKSYEEIDELFNNLLKNANNVSDIGSKLKLRNQKIKNKIAAISSIVEIVKF